MSILLFALLQQGAVSATQAPPQQPDLEIRASIEAREVEIAQEGPLEVRVSGEARHGAGIEVQRSQPPGRSSYRNLQIDARIAAALAKRQTQQDIQLQQQGDTTDEPQD